MVCNSFGLPRFAPSCAQNVPAIHIHRPRQLPHRRMSITSALAPVGLSPKSKRSARVDSRARIPEIANIIAPRGARIVLAAHLA